MWPKKICLLNNSNTINEQFRNNMNILLQLKINKVFEEIVKMRLLIGLSE